MFKLQTPSYFGLDISESAIKLAEIYKARDGYRLRRGRLVELDIDPLFDDSGKRAAVVKEKLKELFSDERIKTGNAAISISGQSVFIRPLKVPKIAKNKIEQILKYEAQLQVPFPINEVIWGYELFDISDTPEIETTLIAVKKEIVEEKLRLLSGTGLEIEFVEMDSFSLFNFLHFIDNSKDKIVLDIGAKITDIIIAGDQKLWTRSILVGGNDLTKAIATDLKISFKEAERLKRKEGIVALTEKDRESSAQAGAISDAISPVLVEFLTDISKSIGYYKSQFGETKVLKEILITGGTSKLRNIAEFVRENIDIPTKSVNLLDKIKGDIDFGVTEDLTGRMDVAVGLALRTVMPLSTKTNLLPREILQAKEFEKKKWYIFGALAAVIMIVMTISGFINALNRTKAITLAKASALVERYTKFHNEMTSLEGEISTLKARLDTISGISEDRRKTIETYAELIRLLPDGLWLTAITQSNETVTLTGRTKGTFEDIKAFKGILAESRYFKNVSVESANVVKDKTAAGDVRDFRIEIELQHPPAAPAGEDKDA